MLPDINIVRAAGGLGRQQPTDDGISALITQGVAVGVAGGLNLNTDYEIRSALAADALGILPANGYTTTRRHIAEYFRLNPGGILIVRVIPQSLTLSDMLDRTESNAQQLLINANGRVKQLAVVLNPAAGYAPTIVAGINADVTAAVAKGQALAMAEFVAHRPVFILVAGHQLAADLTTVTDQRAQNAEFVSVVVGTDHGNAPGEPAIGAALGAIAAARVNESIAWVRKFPLTGNGSFTQAGLSNGFSNAALLPGDLAALSDKGLIVVRQHAGLDGFYFSDTPTCTLASSDYAYLENVRTTNKAARIVRRALLPSLNGPVPVNSDGTLQAQAVGELQGQAVAALTASMIQAGEISQLAVYIDPTQNVISTSVLQVRVSLIPVGVARQINVTLGLTTKVS